ncbi:transcriptional regulator, MarR family [Cellvibrio japonicus Ueda107]|uniref:Transcriptional regulator, MarR family n=2 Tax=Cellvibrio japonicus TaxID=155077 RepID=B3PED8_CELJU|nr:transcriptional regulator, MarR family [Cellvibrio japonicus Ueda107]
MTSPRIAGMLPPIPADLSAAMNQIDEVLTALRRVIRAIDLHSKQLVKTASVTGPQLRLLQLIRNHQGSTLRELADAMSLSQATVTSIMDRLESRGLLVRIRSDRDKRKIHPELTDSGRALLATAPAPLQDNFVRKFDQLQHWEQHMIIASLQRVAEMMDAEDIDAAPYLDIGELDGGNG